MGLFASRPELNNTWAAIPGEPVEPDELAPRLDGGQPAGSTLLGEGTTDITIDLTSISAQVEQAEATVEVDADGD